MMKSILYLSLLVLLNTVAKAQQVPNNPKTITRRFQIDRTTIIKDSTGKTIAFDDWQRAMRTGDYFLRPEHPTDANTPFILYKASAAMKEQRQRLLADRALVKNSEPDNADQFKLTETSIVKDSTGQTLAYSSWHPLIENGSYKVRLENSGSDGPVYMLVKAPAPPLSAQERVKMWKPKESNFFTTGQTIEPFKVRDVAGNKILKESWTGKTIVLNFWFIGCPPCRNEMPELNKLVAKYKDNPNVIFIGVALDQSWEIKDFIKTNPFNYHLIADGRSIAQQFGINLYPTNVVIDRSGKVQFHSSGFSAGVPYWMDKAVAESEAGK